jgi:cell division protein FtsZ
MAIGLATNDFEGAKIRVIGIGGGGGNAINNMIKGGLEGVDFIAANTDKQALDHNLAKVKIQIGKDATRGLGAGAKPELGKKAAEESNNDLKEILKGSDMIFVTAGMGGGTGTGATPIIAKIAKEMGSLVVAIVTKPFVWEGKKRSDSAEIGIAELRENVDALIVIPNQRLLDIIDDKTSFTEAFKQVDDVLFNATRGISDIISCHGIINVDFADVKTVMSGMGDALMGIGMAVGKDRAAIATQKALNSPLLGGISIAGSKGVLVNITGGKDLTMHEIAAAVSIVEQAAGDDANLIHGVVTDSNLTDEIMVTVVATGFKKDVVTANEIIPEIKETQPHLPIPGINNGVKPGLNRPTMPVFTKPEEKKNPFIPQHGIKIGASPFERVPRGDEQLKVYDKPAYERKGLDLTSIGNGSLDSFKKINHGKTIETEMTN